MDDQRDYAEEAYNALYCAECDGPCRGEHCNACAGLIDSEHPGHPVYARLLSASSQQGWSHYACDRF